ncbi:bifunctional diguanylate cyclase/phosphodiesterase [Reinekea marinisedimentorum]|uniref:cyclic-guanylate-specific phosphodiesterase n=1 Tax=Reinekea marinisedimentorum TaxID=230495 RepID=A0A4R3I8L5_9GAMM|nr:EAL domain-containing protein [Reinekea marinisedimentorum]TCS41336.1 diguanylate cyclase (GGDEF)-like protein [Reinekea marinisedimentorum]
MKLQTRYSLLLTGMILSVLVVLGTLLFIQFRITLKNGLDSSSQILEANLDKQLERNGTNLNHVLAINLANPVYSFDTEEMYHQLQSVLSLPSVEYAIIYDNNGALIHEGEEEISRYGELLTDPFMTNALKAEDYLTQKSDSILDVSHPLFIGSQQLGGVRVGLSLTENKQDIQTMGEELRHVFEQGISENLLLFGSTILLIVGLFGVVLATTISRNITRPIKLLAEYANNVSSGKINYPVGLPNDRRDELGELSRSIVKMIIGLKEINDRARHQAKHDQLTNIPNRTLFNEYLETALANAEQKEHEMAILFIDLDDFKRINDTLGHAAGDELLQQFSKRLSSSLRAHDFMGVGHDETYAGIARLGGDEFTVLLDNISSDENIIRVADRILSKAQQPFSLSSGQEIVVGASIGITMYPKDGTEKNQLLSNADIAMYSAKSRGKNNFAFFTSSMNTEVQNRLELENDLRSAMENKQLKLYYQPLFSSLDNRVVGAEALLRWQHPKKGFISPDAFIPVAEQTGLIHTLGEWVIETACEQVKRWQQHSRVDLYCAVNISGVQLLNRNLPENIKAITDRHQLTAGNLHIELTETALLTNEEDASNILEELHAQGIDIWMDDFGTGYSSLSFLKKFCAQGVKVDKSFIHDMETDEDSRGIVKAVIAMAKSLNLRITAEGLETASQVEQLREYGCDNLQGYYLARPMPAEQLSEMMIRLPELFKPFNTNSVSEKAS